MLDIYYTCVKMYIQFHGGNYKTDLFGERQTTKKNKFLHNVVVYILTFNFFFRSLAGGMNFIHLYRQAPTHTNIAAGVYR